MSEDSFIEKLNKHHERWHGEEWTADKTRETFIRHGRANRIAALDQLDQAVRAEPATDGNLRRYSQLTALQRDLQTIHAKMIKVGR